MPSSINNRKALVELARIADKKFTYEHWDDLSVLTGCPHFLGVNSALRRDLYVGIKPSDSCVIEAFNEVVCQNSNNLKIIADYIEETFQHKLKTPITNEVCNHSACAPTEFQIPMGGIDNNLIALMMPFSPGFDPINEVIKSVTKELGFICNRVDDIWNNSTIIQDIFSLIYKARIVICDFSGKNANVFYEAGIAHALGRVVIPLVQDLHDIPFDLQHHRLLVYSSNQQGLQQLKEKLREKLIQELNSNNH